DGAGVGDPDRHERPAVDGDGAARLGEGVGRDHRPAEAAGAREQRRRGRGAADERQAQPGRRGGAGLDETVERGRHQRQDAGGRVERDGGSRGQAAHEHVQAADRRRREGELPAVVGAAAEGAGGGGEGGGGEDDALGAAGGAGGEDDRGRSGGDL